MDAAIAIIQKILYAAVELGPTVFKAEEELAPFAAAIVQVFKGETLSDDQLAGLQAISDALHGQIQAADDNAAPTSGDGS